MSLAVWQASTISAIAPDLYSRQGNKVTKDPNVAGELMSGLQQSDGIDDLLSTVDWLKAQGGVRATHIGLIGFCMGGSYSMALPCVSRERPRRPSTAKIPADEKLQNLNCPILYAYGENDGWIQRRDVDRLAAALRRLNKQGEVKVYAGCSHGFFNDTRPDVYSAKDTRDAWERTLKLFDQNLKH